MGFTYRKSKKVGPFRFTVSKSGISTSVGGKGYRVTRKTNGRIQTTTSIPGTGIRYTKQISRDKGYSYVKENRIIHSRNYYKVLYILANITSIVFAILSLLLLFILLPMGIILSALTVFVFLIGKEGKKIYLNYDKLNKE